jgi:hypothetical protein
VRTGRVILTLAVLTVLGGGGFLAARLIGNAVGSGGEQPGQVDEKLTQQPGQVDEKLIQQRQATERAQPRFTGELLGIFIAPSEDLWPEQARADQAQLVAGGCVGVPRSLAGALEFPRPLTLPTGYVPKEEQPATACSGKVTGLGWEYTVTGANGIPANVSISRTVARALVFDVAADRVSVRNIGGRDAIFIRPITPDGLAQISYVVFPEPFGETEIQTFNLPEAGVSAVAEAVADASK